MEDTVNIDSADAAVTVQVINGIIEKIFQSSVQTDVKIEESTLIGLVVKEKEEGTRKEEGPNNEKNEVQEVAEDDDASKCTNGSSSSSSFSPEYRCPICLDLLHEPLLLDPCGHTFCDPCLRRLGNERHSRCPVCRSPILQCKPNDDIKAEVKAAHPKQYEVRGRNESRTDVYSMPLPPVRRPMLEAISEWILVNLSSPYFLTSLALVAVVIQLAIVVTLTMLNRSRWSNNMHMFLRGVNGFSRLRGGAGWRRPVMVKVILVYSDAQQSTLYEGGSQSSCTGAFSDFGCYSYQEGIDNISNIHELFFNNFMF